MEETKKELKKNSRKMKQMKMLTSCWPCPAAAAAASAALWACKRSIVYFFEEQLLWVENVKNLNNLFIFSSKISATPFDYL